MTKPTSVKPKMGCVMNEEVKQSPSRCFHNLKIDLVDVG